MTCFTSPYGPYTKEVAGDNRFRRPLADNTAAAGSNLQRDARLVMDEKAKALLEKVG
jgi:hypothetical protein